MNRTLYLLHTINSLLSHFKVSNYYRHPVISYKRVQFELTKALLVNSETPQTDNQQLLCLYVNADPLREECAAGTPTTRLADNGPKS